MLPYRLLPVLIRLAGLILMLGAAPAMAQTTSGGEALGDAASAQGNAAEAYYQYQSACAYGSGQAGACHKAGDMHAEGLIGSKDPRQAREYYGYACKAGEGDTCGALGAAAAGDGDEVKARALFKKGCDLNDGLSCLDYGRSLTMGLGGMEDREGAKAANRRACELGVADGCKFAAVPDEPGYVHYRAAMNALDAGDMATGHDTMVTACVTDHYGDACIFLARHVHEGQIGGQFGGQFEGRAEDEREYLRLACDYDMKRTLCTAYADMLHAGTGGPRNDKAALIIYRDTCDAIHDLDACYGLAMIMRDGTAGGPYDPAKIRGLFRYGCENGHHPSCFEAAVMLRSGEGLKGNGLPKAVSMFLTECEYGNAQACYEYGNMLAEGQGRDADAAEARAGWRKGCDGGFAAACAALGEDAVTPPSAAEMAGMTADQAFDRGWKAYGRKDYAVARDLFLRACDLGHGRGCTYAASIDQAGQAGARDLVQARALYLRGCDRGYAASCSEAGRMLRFGEGGPTDDNGGFALYRKACDMGGDSLACDTAREGESRP